MPHQTELPTTPWINGEPWTGPAPATRDIRNPFDGERIAQVRQADAGAVEAALASAVAAFEVVRRQPRARRKELLREIVAGLKEHADTLARVIQLEAGKPVKLARGEVQRAITTFDLAAEEAGRIDGEYLGLDADVRTPGFRGIVERVPLGVISAITPFNFPLNLVAHKVAPALAAGNTVVHKPASATPLSALLLAQIVHDAGAVSGAYNVVPCSPDTARPLVTDPRPRMVSFTGSAAVGWEIKARAGRKRVVLELGGNAPNLVHGDADLAAAAQRLAFGAFAYAGQVCISVQRVLVQDTVYDRFRELLLAAARAVPCGDPADPGVVCGPMISASEADRVAAWIDEAVRGGGRLALAPSRRGQVLTPAIVEEPPPDCALVREEAFGPVLTLHRYATLEEGLRLANDTDFGLQAGLFTSDINAAFLAFRELDYGGIVVNDSSMVRIDSYPYGGTKGSGLGREGIRYAIEEMTDRRILVLRLPDLED